MHLRGLQARLSNAMGDTPVVCLVGASRTGKSTLLRALQAESPAAGPSLADPAVLAWASGDPEGFLAGLPAFSVLDDLHRAPGLIPLLKAAVGRGQRFLLAASGPLPGLAESLAGSLESFTLWPLAQAEGQGVVPGLIDTAFQGDLDRLRLEPLDRQELLRRVLAGGYPEARDRAPLQRERWFHAYLAALVQGDLRALTDLREVHQLTRLLVAPGADPAAAARCRDLLVRCQVLAELPSGSGPRYRYCNDSGLHAHLLGVAPAALEARPVLAAPFLETFAAMELVKTAPWSRSRPRLSHLAAGNQTLLVLEDHRRDLVAFAVDASATIQAEAFAGLRELRNRVGDRLRAGIVLHPGEDRRSAGPGLWAMPLPALWAARG